MVWSIGSGRPSRIPIPFSLELLSCTPFLLYNYIKNQVLNSLNIPTSHIVIDFSFPSPPLRSPLSLTYNTMVAPSTFPLCLQKLQQPLRPPRLSVPCPPPSLLPHPLSMTLTPAPLTGSTRSAATNGRETITVVREGRRRPPIMMLSTPFLPSPIAAA
jgi:hypothetical protein